MRNRNNSKKG